MNKLIMIIATIIVAVCGQGCDYTQYDDNITFCKEACPVIHPFTAFSKQWVNSIGKCPEQRDANFEIKVDVRLNTLQSQYMYNVTCHILIFAGFKLYWKQHRENKCDTDHEKIHSHL